MVQFLQEGTPLGSIMARIEIEEQVTTTVKNRFVRADHLAVGDKSESPDLTLFVHYDMMQTQPRLLFNLYRDGQLSESWPPAVLHADTRSYHAEIYQRLSDLTDVFDIQRDSPDTMEVVDRQLRSLGQSLWNDLIPEGLQQLYALERAEWHGRSLLVVTDEPHIPWELMWPYGYQGESWEDEQPWCMSMRMTRWLHQDGEGAGLHGPPSQLEIERFAFAGPSDLSLAAIERKAVSCGPSCKQPASATPAWTLVHSPVFRPCSRAGTTTGCTWHPTGNFRPSGRTPGRPSCWRAEKPWHPTR